MAKTHNANCYEDPSNARPAVARDVMDDALSNAGLKEGCFPGDTLVHVDEVNEYGEKLKSIQYIQVGDRVLSRCEKTGEVAYKRVTKVFSHDLRRTYCIACKFGPEVPPRLAALGVIYATPEHPFWVSGKGWIKVRDLNIGDPFVTHDGVHAEVGYIRADLGCFDVFNIEVEDFHTYFVDWSGVWVHNKKPLGTSGV